MKIKFKKLDENATIPSFAHKGDSGMDIRTVEDYNLAPFEFKVFKTGIACAVDEGYEVQVRARSGLACKRGVTVINGIGTIDSNYRGEIGVGLVNHSKEFQHIEKGDRIAQLVIAKVEQPDVEVVLELDETVRADGGFGSTGVK